MLPEFSGLQNYAQLAVVSLIVIVMLVLVVITLCKREFGALVGVILVGALLIVVVKNPDGTIVKIAQGIINKLMGNG